VRGATGFRSLTEAVDTTTAGGRMMMQMLGSSAEFERSTVRERTRAGRIAARDRGVKVGRPAKLSHHQQQEIIHTVREGCKTAADAAGALWAASLEHPALAGARGRTISLRRQSYSRKSSSASVVVR
jgi:DNA invertase Pin-like site-specific DNA recombinase